MKVQIEGSERDIRGLFNDSAAAKESAKAELRSEMLQKELDTLGTKLVTTLEENVALRKSNAAAGQKLAELHNSMNAMRMELGSKNAYIAMQDNEVKQLQATLNDPVKLSEEQQARVEEVYQEMITKFGIKPVTFSLPEGQKIGADYMIFTIFSALAAGDKVGAIKEARAATGMSLQKLKTLMDAALMAFGCKVNDRGCPTPVIGPKAEKPVE